MSRPERLADLLKYSSGNQISFQRLVFSKIGQAHDAEADDASLRVHTLHHGIVLGFLVITGGIGKTDFKEIRLRIEPNFYFIGHKSSPAFGWSVRQAVTTNAVS